jgi:hypothetical protein
MNISLDVNALLNGDIVYASKYGSASHTKWHCEDNWIAGYTTEKIVGSIAKENDGKFACLVWKPIKLDNGRTQWKIVYFRTFTKRKTAKEYALKHYYKHSPIRAKRHGVSA